MNREGRALDDVSVQVLDIGQFLLQYHGNHGNRGNQGNLAVQEGVEFCNYHRRNDLDTSQKCFTDQCRLVSSIWKVRISVEKWENYYLNFIY